MMINTTHATDPTLATRLASLRRAAGLTQDDLSRRSGVKLSTLQKLEQGGDLLAAKTGTVLALARALGMSVEEVVGG